MDSDAGSPEDGHFHLIGSGGEHGLGREILCSLPRSVSCRLCKGEQDCPYIVERPVGRLVIRKREPTSLVVRDLLYVATGSTNDPTYRTPLRQRVVAIVGWSLVPLLLFWVVFVHRPGADGIAWPGIVMLASFLVTVAGVPMVRWQWRDHGGVRRGGPWRPS